MSWTIYTSAAYVRGELFRLIKWFMAFWRLMPCFCDGCHSNRGIARVVAQAREKLALAQCEFASYVRRKQAQYHL